MNKEKLEKFRQQLVAMRGRLRSDLEGLRNSALRQTGGEASGGLSNTPLHMADLGSDNFAQEIAAGMLQNEHDLLLAIDVALDRIDAGRYGICKQCGQEIPEERLKALPYAIYCVSCQKKVEGAGRGD
jgi:RNA polymerase-binding transcription factor DksA